MDSGKNVFAVSFSNSSSGKPVARAILLTFEEDVFLPFRARNVVQSLKLDESLLKIHTTQSILCWKIPSHTFSFACVSI